jgi:hypothetical protein
MSSSLQVADGFPQVGEAPDEGLEALGFQTKALTVSSLELPELPKHGFHDVGFIMASTFLKTELPKHRLPCSGLGWCFVDGFTWQ